MQSRYQRRAADLPLGGRRVDIQVLARRFRCEVATCTKRIFAERFPTDILPAFARRTARLEQVVHHLGLALGGRPAAGLAQRLRLPVSRDTLLRVIRRHAAPRPDVLKVVGIDVFRVRQSSLEAYLPWLDAQWEAGARNATELWRRAKEQGHPGSLRVAGE